MKEESLPKKGMYNPYEALRNQIGLEAESSGVFPSSYLTSSDPIVRFIAIHYFATVYARTREDRYPEIGLITPFLEDPDSRVRERAFHAVLSLGMSFDPDSDELVSVAGRAVDDPDFEVRRVALDILNWKMPDVPDIRKKYIPLLEKALNHKDDKTREEAAKLVAGFIRYYEDPFTKIDEILEDESYDVRLTVASLFSAYLPQIFGSEKVFEHFKRYPIEKFPEIHFCLAAIGLFDRGFCKNKAFQEHIARIVQETNDWFTMDQVLWIAAKRLDPLNSNLRNIILAGLESENEQMRMIARHYYNLYLEWSKRYEASVLNARQ